MYKRQNIHTIKPLDEELVVAAAKECGRVVTVEEHSVIGGLGAAVCETLSRKAPTPVKTIGIQDCFGESGPAVALLKKYGLCLLYTSKMWMKYERAMGDTEAYNKLCVYYANLHSMQVKEQIKRLGCLLYTSRCV